jgi:peptidoglycan/LPS O-acetylase OafA/YrhL
MNLPNETLGSAYQTEPLLRPVMPELDAIRGIAILGVLFYHGLFWGIDLSRFPAVTRVVLTGMWVGRLGVNLFFVLSGFLITGLLVDSKHRADYYSRFYIRRALRILPAYLLTISALIAVASAPWKFVALSLLYLSNLTPLWSIPIAYPVLWSLAVEEHFYFVWPAVTRKLTLRQVLICCIGIILLSPVSRLATFFLTQRNGFVSFVCNEYTWNSADGLACGAMLAIYLRLYPPSRRQLLRLLFGSVGLALSLWLLALPWGIWTRQRPVGAALQVVPWQFVFIALLGGFLLLGTSRWKKLVHSTTLRFFGEISYGLYLYHLLAFDGVDYLARRESLSWMGTQNLAALLIRFAVSSAIAIAISFISRRMFENRFLEMKGRLTPD